MIIPACKIGNLVWVGERTEGDKEEDGMCEKYMVIKNKA